MTTYAGSMEDTLERFLIPDLPPNIWVIEAPWITSATALVGRSSGSASVQQGYQDAGVYSLATRDTKYYLPVPLPITSLVYQGTTLMTDSPRDYYAMVELGFRARGSVLVGGYGLGIVHHILKANPAVFSVITVEQIEDVANLAPERPLMEDFFEYARDRGGEFDTFLTDIAPTDWHGTEYAILREQLIALRGRFPGVLHLHHGYQRLFDVGRFHERWR